jgi:hypothetical protein
MLIRRAQCILSYAYLRRLRIPEALSALAVQVVASRRCMGQDSGSNLQVDLLSADTTGLMLLDDAQKEVPVAGLMQRMTYADVC